MARSPTKRPTSSASRTGTRSGTGGTTASGKFTNNQWTTLMKHLQPLKPQARRAATKSSSRSKTMSSGGGM